MYEVCVAAEDEIGQRRIYVGTMLGAIVMEDGGREHADSCSCYRSGFISLRSLLANNPSYWGR